MKQTNDSYGVYSLD